MSDESGDQGIEHPEPEVRHALAPQNNFARLLAHLDKDSLAGKMVKEYAEADAPDRIAAIKAVAKDRLEEMRRIHVEAEN